MSPEQAARLDRWSLRRRLAAATVGLVVLMVLVVALATVLLLGAKRSQDHVTGDFFDAYRLSTEGFTELVAVEAGVRSYLVTGDDEALAPLQGALREGGPDRDARLRRLLVEEPAVLAALARAQDSAQEWYAGWAQPAIAAVQRGGPQAVSTVERQRGATQFDAIRTAYQAYLDELLDARARAMDRLELYTRLLFVAIVVGAVASVAAGFALRVLLRRWVLEPLAEVATETRAVRTGDLDHRVESAGPPEIAALARDVDLMRLALVEQIVRLDHARAEVEAARARLEEQAQELSRSNRDLEQFAYVASHDLQEPLRKVASFCQMLERRYKGQLDERADQYIAFAVDGAKRMQALINDLLAFSRVGRVSAGQAEVDLDDCLAEALRRLEQAIEDAGATITADPLPTVWGEPALLTQLLQNLIGNAVKFRSEEPPRIHIGARRVGGMWQLCCADNGIGIEPQYAERIFVIFQRLHPRDEYEGTGIGLAMCKKIVEYHGGKIWLDPDVERGTALRWTLPAERPAQPVNAPEERLGEPSEEGWSATPRRTEDAVPAGATVSGPAGTLTGDDR